jgi:hypothetical protein
MGVFLKTFLQSILRPLKNVMFLCSKGTVAGVLYVCPQSTYRGRVEIGGCISALSASVYTTTFLVMVDRVKRGGPATPTFSSLG